MEGYWIFTMLSWCWIEKKKLLVLEDHEQLFQWRAVRFSRCWVGAGLRWKKFACVGRSWAAASMNDYWMFTVLWRKAVGARLGRDVQPLLVEASRAGEVLGNRCCSQLNQAMVVVLLSIAGYSNKEGRTMLFFFNERERVPSFVLLVSLWGGNWSRVLCVCEEIMFLMMCMTFFIL